VYVRRDSDRPEKENEKSGESPLVFPLFFGQMTERQFSLQSFNFLYRQILHFLYNYNCMFKTKDPMITKGDE